jgi:large conductance mechanosensitive channel
MWKEFKEFAVRGNVIDMAVGIIIGAAFTGVVQSLVKDVMLPILGVITGSVDFSRAYLVLREGTTAGPYPSLQAAQEAGAVIVTYGTFLNSVVSFLLVSFAVFLLVRYINKLRRPVTSPGPVVPTLKKCSFCCTDIAADAIRCPNCTSQLQQQT